MIQIHDSRVTRQPNDDEKPITLAYVQDNMHHVLLGEGEDLERAKADAIAMLKRTINTIEVMR